MNSYKVAFKAFFIFSMIGILLGYRYVTIGISIQQVVSFLLYYFFGVGILAFSLIRFKDTINPISIYSIFLFLLSYSLIRLSKDQIEYSISTYFLLNVSIISFLVSASINYESRPLQLLKINKQLKRYLLYTICIASTITFVIECVLFGYLPVLNIGNTDVYIDTNAKLVPFLHYFIVLLAFVPSWSFILYKEKVLKKTEYRLLLFITLFILVNYLSRQLYLLLGITFFMSYSYYSYVNTKKIFRGIILIVVLFMTVGYLKFNSDTSVSFSEYSRLVAGIDNENVTILESTFTEYSSKRYTALDKMVRYRDDINYWGMGIYTFRPFFSFFLLEKTGVVKRIPELDSERNVGTYAIDPYLDYGLIGALIINLLYGYLSARYYKQYKNRYPEAILKFSIIVFCLLMGMFINYFNTMLIWLGIIFNKILIGGLRNNK